MTRARFVAVIIVVLLAAGLTIADQQHPVFITQANQTTDTSSLVWTGTVPGFDHPVAITFEADRADLLKQYDRLCYREKCLSINRVLDLIESDGTAGP
jgi:hypothetical protein